MVIPIDVHVTDSDPDEELLALDPGHALHLAVLDEGRHLGAVRDLPPDLLEGVRERLLLAQPDEAGGAVVAHLLDVCQRQQAQRHVGLGQQLHRLLGAQRRAVLHTRPLPVHLNCPRPHLMKKCNLPKQTLAQL